MVIDIFMHEGKTEHHCWRIHLLLFAIMGIAFLSPLASSQSTISQGDIVILKTYADAFNQSRNYMTSSGPAEQYCMTSGTFLAYKPCSDIPSCTLTANLVCSVSGAQGCEIDVLAADILAYKNGVDSLDAAYSSFMSGYSSFSQSNIASSLSQMDSAFDSMKSAADAQSQSKLRMPNLIPCPCGSNPADCCIGRCPEARFNYTALASGKARISAILIKSCSDGTPGGQCSAQKPMECVLGQLVGNANKCSCPSGMRATANGQGCESIPCIDNGASVPSGACSQITIGKKCVGGSLVDMSSVCGCPSGKRPSADGKTCEFNPCIDNWVSVPNGNCSPQTIGKKCVNGTLLDMASACGCPAGQFATGNTCACPVITTRTCNFTSVTKYHVVTYIFDRGDEKTANVSYTFEKERCYSILNIYTGTNCTRLVNLTTNSTPVFESPDEQQSSAIVVPCSQCPAICNRSKPIGIACGSCLCPSNLGFCNTTGERENMTGIPVYCADGMLQPQKVDYNDCANGFECMANECRNSLCYDRQNDILQLIIDWVQNLIGYGK